MAKEWYDRFDWKRGFWYSYMQIKSRQLYAHIRADYAVPKQDAKGLLLELHNYVKSQVQYRHEESPRMFRDVQDIYYLWERDAEEWVDSAISVETVLRSQPEWEPFTKIMEGP